MVALHTQFSYLVYFLFASLIGFLMNFGSRNVGCVKPQLQPSGTQMACASTVTNQQLTYVRTIVISDKTSYIPERPEGRRDQRDPDSVSFLFVFPFNDESVPDRGRVVYLKLPVIKGLVHEFISFLGLPVQ